VLLTLAQLRALPAGEHVTLTAAVASFTRHPVSAQNPRLHVRCRLQDSSLAGLERKHATVQWTHTPDRQAGPFSACLTLLSMP
jgi:hypothetical protein